jgi:hypothetical protein
MHISDIDTKCLYIHPVMHDGMCNVICVISCCFCDVDQLRPVDQSGI